MAQPSKVIHIRNVSSDVTEQDIQQLAQSFGVVQKVVIMRQKNQALVEMPDLPSALNLVNYYSSVQPQMRGRNVYLQFSSHQQLTTQEGNGAAAEGAGGGEGRVGGRMEGAPNRILLVTVHHPLYPINVDVLHQVFSPHGFVEKIVVFQKSAGLQALVQYNNQGSAVAARTQLQGRNIYDGCCTLDIQFSNLSELQVHANNERTRDYTNSSLPEQAGAGRGGPGGLGLFGDGGGIYGAAGAAAAAAAAAGMGRGLPPVGFPHQGMGVGGPFNQMNPMASAAATATLFGGHLPPGLTGQNNRCTLLASNINTDAVDVDKLFNLFSNYGNIVRIKFLHSKTDHALIQMAEGIQAEMAVLYLKGVTLSGKKLELNYSKHETINPSPEAKEYANSNLNRFLRNASKNYRHCCAPTKMLHVSNLPPDVTEAQVVEHLTGSGTIVGSKIIDKDGKKQVLVLFDSPESALDTLVAKHATPLPDTQSVIRIAFSKTASL